jgi:hypothetical protein
MKQIGRLILFSLIYITSSCRKDSTLKKDIQDPVVPKPIENIKYGSVRIKIANVVGKEMLVLNDSSYFNTNGDLFTVSKFKYYLSNFVLRNANGTAFKQKESYHLIDCQKGSNFTMIIDSVPVGTYNAMNFVLGVDSARNTSGAQTGALDPALGMFWSWNQGYIFLMMEGNSPNSTAFGNSLIYHLGGFTQPYNCIRNVNPGFGALDLIVSENKTSTIQIAADMIRMFDSPTLIKFAQTSEGMGGAVAVTLSNNAVNMFEVNAIEN